jgi:hypothetical protein
MLKARYHVDTLSTDVFGPIEDQTLAVDKNTCLSTLAYREIGFNPAKTAQSDVSSRSRLVLCGSLIYNLSY